MAAMATDEATRDEKFVAQQSMDVDEYLPPPPLCTVRPESLEKKQEKYPGFHYEGGAKEARTNKTSTGLAKTYTRKRGRPLCSKSSKGMVEQKWALFDGSSGSCSYSKDGDFEPPTQARKRRRPSRSSKGKIDYIDSSRCSSEGKKDIEPPTPTRKRERPARSKSSNMKIGYAGSSSSSDGRKHKDCDFELEVSDDDDSHKKYASVKGTAMHRAEKLMEELPPDGLRFIKYMKTSHVEQGFWLGLPRADCRENFPDGDAEIILEDEEGMTFKTRYLAYKTGLSGGWGGFAQKHELEVDDVLVFQLVEPRKFKVYIVKKSKVTTTDGALGLPSLDTSMETNTSSKKGSSKKGTKSKKVPTKKRRNVPEVVTRGRGGRKPSSNEGDKLAREEAAGGGISYGGRDHTSDFVAVENLENFHILVGDGSVVGHVVLPDSLSMVYYTLCHSRKAFLHRNLATQICTTLVTGMIVQTASIAEGIMAASPALEDLVSWKKTLESFESMGMDVAFMYERVDKLIDLLSTPTMEEPEGYAELERERARLAKQVRDLESRLSNLKNAGKEMGVEMEEMNPKKKRDQAVRELATAPW